MSLLSTLLSRPRSSSADTEAHPDRVEAQEALGRGREPEVAAEAEWDLVDQASWESFPASDPPGWIHRRASRSRAGQPHPSRPPS